MLTRFSKDLSRQEIYAHGDELSSVMGMDRDAKGKRIYSHPDHHKKLVTVFDDPVLVTDTYKIGRLSPALRDTVFKLLESAVKTTEYDGVSLRFDQKKYRGAWGPSIDTLLFTKGLSMISLKGVRSFIEVGAGSGFISKYLLAKNRGVKKATLIDLNPHAIQSCKDNIDDPRVSFVVGDAIPHLKRAKVDCIVCNPPYIPRPKSIDDNPYEGTGLLSYLITHAHEILTPGGRIITNVSSLSEKEMRAVVQGSDLELRTVISKTVPLKVCNVFNNKKWLSYLLAHGLSAKRKNGYDFYHTITIIELIRKEDGEHRVTRRRR